MRKINSEREYSSTDLTYRTEKYNDANLTAFFRNLRQVVSFYGKEP